ncbi:MAG: folate-binding protein [Hyphomicrobiaceae bacterium]
MSVEGPDTRKFLQGLLTADVGRLDRQRALAAALLTPQGKVLVEMIVTGTADGVLIDCPLSETGNLVKRLTLYKLRAKIEILDRTSTLAVVWTPPGAGAVGFADPRHPGLGFRSIVDAADAHGSGDAAYDAHRIVLGIAEQDADFGPSEVFPHEASYDQLGSVDFDKGCYVGQEVVSRMQHRGTARSRFVPVSASAELPPKGTPVTAAGREIGQMGSHQGNCGLVLMRLDRLADAVAAGTTPEAAGVALRAHRPGWAHFDIAGAETSP